MGMVGIAEEVMTVIAGVTTANEEDKGVVMIADVEDKEVVMIVEVVEDMAIVVEVEEVEDMEV